jgi:pyruvate/2-oxoglutarate/acetoin dehydrogenase E1 component
MRENFTSGTVRGVPGNRHSYRGVFETIFEYLKAPVKRVTLPDIPTPASRILEEVYYPTAKNIVQAVRSVIGTKISVKIKEVGT